MLVTTIPVSVEGQKTGSADLCAYIEDRLFEGEYKPAVLVLGGGAYARYSPREGEPVAMMYASLGFHAFVLKYSVMPNVYPVAMNEVGRALEIIREHAEDWHVDAEHLFLSGFSSGGHLALCYAEHRALSFPKPAGLILSYPVISSGEFAHKPSFEHLLGSEVLTEEHKKLLDEVSLEKHVDAKKVPPVFLWTTWTDQIVTVENALMLARSLKDAGVNTELHIFRKGPHSLSLATKYSSAGAHEKNDTYVQTWTSLLKNWLFSILDEGNL
ncbi:MAG TPA: hypothetical protein DCQ43_04325 [Treponema sp.]|nr:hypothetical protein [Treponema sp.]HBD68895.1 hypothetical protein [Treponema sp.]